MFYGKKGFGGKSRYFCPSFAGRYGLEKKFNLLCNYDSANHVG